MTAGLVLVLSIALATGAIYLARDDALMRAAAAFIYFAWHLPLVISLCLPYRVPFEVPVTDGVVMGLLAATHLIVWSLVLGYRSTSRQPRVEYLAERSIPFAVVLIAYAAPVLLMLDLVLLRGVHLTGDLASNRVATSGAKSAPGQLGAVASGFALYLLLHALRGNGLPRVRWSYLVPYALVGAISLVSGNRQFVFIGLLVLALRGIYVSDISLRKLTIIAPAVVLALALLGVGFNLVRQSATAGRQDTFLEAIGGITVDSGPQSPISRSYTVRTMTMSFYYYYGNELSAFSRLWHTFSPDAPKGSMTVPALYRRWSGVLGQPDQTDVDDTVHVQIAQDLGVLYPRIWPTMYANVLYEWGREGVVVFALIAALCAAIVGRAYAAFGNPNYVVVAASMAAFGVMYLATYEVPILGLFIAALAVRLGSWASSVALDSSGRWPGRAVGSLDRVTMASPEL